MTYDDASSLEASKALSLTSVKAWTVWILGCLFYFYECLLQVSASVMSTELMRDFSLTSHTLGILVGIYFYSYAPMQMPGGLLMDYFGPRRLLTIATAVCALGTLLFGITDQFYIACLARLMMGFGSAFAAVGTMKLAANWFPANRFALLTGMLVAIGMAGAIVGEAPMALLIDNFGWRDSLLIMGVIGLILAVLIFLIAKDTPASTKPKIAILRKPTREPIISSLLALIKNKQLWCVAIYGGLMFMSTPVFCGLWGVPFLMLKMGLAKATAANYISLVFVGWVIASPLWGIYSNRIGRRKPPMYIGAFGALTTSLLFIYAPIQSHGIMEILLFAFGVFSAGFLSAFSVAKELCGQQYVATGLGFMNMLNMVGPLIAQPLIGYILDLMWQGQLQDKVRVYPLEAYYVGLSILPLAIFISLIILTRLRETYCKPIAERH